MVIIIYNYNEFQKVFVCNVVVVILFVWMDPGVLDLYLSGNMVAGVKLIDVSAGRVVTSVQWPIFVKGRSLD